MNLVITYAPTIEVHDEQTEAFYNAMEQTLRNPLNREIAIMLGDFNVKISVTIEDHDL